MSGKVIGSITIYCFYLDNEETDSFDGTTFKTKEDFYSGEVAYLLSQGTDGSVWGQDLSQKNSYPTLGGKTVYSDVVVYPGCETVPGTPTSGYGNSIDPIYKGHDYQNGFCAFCDVCQTATLNGDGVYEISNAGQLYWFASQVNGGSAGMNAVLTADIIVNTGDVSGCDGVKADGWRDWTPIGISSSASYTGNFDGKGYTVSGLYLSDKSRNIVALFGCIKSTVSNVGVLNSYFEGKDYVSGLCGFNIGTIKNCYSDCTVAQVSSANDYLTVGGVCGQNSGGTLQNCYNAAKITRIGNSLSGSVCAVK